MRVYPKGPESIIQIENDHALRSRSVKIESHETFLLEWCWNLRGRGRPSEKVEGGSKLSAGSVMGVVSTLVR